MADLARLNGSRGAVTMGSEIVMGSDAHPVSLPIGRLCGPSPVGVSTRLDDRYGLLLHFVSGRVQLRHLVAAVEASLDLGLAEFVLWSVTRGDLSALSLADLEQWVEHLVATPWAPRRSALLCPVGPSLAAAAAVTAMAEDLGCGGRVCAFVNRETALEWLGIHEAQTTPAPPLDVSSYG